MRNLSEVVACSRLDRCRLHSGLRTILLAEQLRFALFVSEMSGSAMSYGGNSAQTEGNPPHPSEDEAPVA